MVGKEKRKAIIVVGAGPAGMMAAIRAAELGGQVTIVDKNKLPGRKLLLTGGGRCNITNECEIDGLIDRFSKTGAFLRDAFKAFGSSDLMEFFRSRGLELKVGDKGRVFPKDDKASSVLGVLEEEMKSRGVRTFYGSCVKDITIKDSEALGVELDNGTLMESDSVVLATGGVSYSVTGSTGEGIEMAEGAGHEKVSLRPGLVGLELEGDIPKQLQGLTLDSARLTVMAGKKKIRQDVDSLLFTARGISGPAAISASAKVQDMLDRGERVKAVIDLVPDQSETEVEAALLAEMDKRPGNIIKSIIRGIFPERLTKVILDSSEISADKKANQVTAAERRRLVSVLKGICFEVTGTAPLEKAMITRGGVSVKDIDPRTMASRKVRGLYFAGEMIDVDADTGGYNLQAAFSTGYLAGQSAYLDI